MYGRTRASRMTTKINTALRQRPRYSPRIVNRSHGYKCQSQCSLCAIHLLPIITKPTQISRWCNHNYDCGGNECSTMRKIPQIKTTPCKNMTKLVTGRGKTKNKKTHPLLLSNKRNLAASHLPKSRAPD